MDHGTHSFIRTAARRLVFCLENSSLGVEGRSGERPGDFLGDGRALLDHEGWLTL